MTARESDVALHLYNTATRRKEPFEPLDARKVRMYVCGPTVYDLAHIGNARPVIVFDVLFRLLRRQYGADHVTYVRNITDVDDKIIAAARESGEPIDAITARTTAAYHADTAALGCLEPTVEPRATRHIAEMQAMIAKLIAEGYAYAADGHVLFEVAKFADYGKLSRKNRDELIEGARVEVAPYKKDPADFVLWKPSTPEQPGWDSPWGRGRPGWHIECSAMSMKHLGATFDIHGGGRDLIFPHHENEVAQSTCANHAPFARYWVHNGFVTVNGQKMSKSLGNFFTVRDLLAKHPPEAIRLNMLKTHYRHPLDWTEEGVREAKANLDRWYRSLEALVHIAASEADAERHVVEALEDDLNTPLAVSRIVAFVNEVERNRSPDTERLVSWLSISKGAGRPIESHSEFFELQKNSSTKRDAAGVGDYLNLKSRVPGWLLPPADAERRLEAWSEAKAGFIKSGELLGILQSDPVRWRKTGGMTAITHYVSGVAAIRLAGQAEAALILGEESINQMIARRAAAKKARNFAEADRIRDELKAQGIVLEDKPGGVTEWRRAG